MIVALPEGAVARRDDDPVGDGYLFVDPTQTAGGVRWLGSGAQDQDALVVRDGGGALARTPILHRLERRTLVVNAVVDGAGDARGGAGLALTGDLAADFLHRAAAAPPAETEEGVRAVFGALLPGVTLGKVGWSAGEGEVPALDLAAAVAIPALLQGESGRRSVQLPALKATPEPSRVAGRATPVVLQPLSIDTTWRLTLPTPCRASGADEPVVDNAVGAFRQTVAADDGDGRITVERRSEVRRRWIEPDLLPALAELALAEHRANRRRIRLDCGAARGAGAAGAAGGGAGGR
jgi:hypothetical protein